MKFAILALRNDEKSNKDIIFRGLKALECSDSVVVTSNDDMTQIIISSKAESVDDIIFKWHVNSYVAGNEGRFGFFELTLKSINDASLFAATYCFCQRIRNT